MAHLGSLAAPLATPEALRPWAQNGLTALYLPGGLPQAAPGATPVTAPDSAHAAPREGHAATAPRWVEPWKSLAERVRATPKVIITYMDLAVDLSGTPHPDRRKLFRDILAYLSWPQGTSLFWPLCSLKNGKACLSTEIFAAGARHFGVSHVACFGRDAAAHARAVLSAEDDAKVLELPAPQDLANRLPHELHMGVRVLKELVLK